MTAPLRASVVSPLVARARALLALVTYKDWHFHVREDRSGDTVMQVAFVEDDVHLGLPTRQYGRKHRLSEWMTDSEIIQTAFLAVLVAEEHEARERFMVEGEAIYGPHFDFRDLVTLARRTRRDQRPPAPADPTRAALEVIPTAAEGAE